MKEEKILIINTFVHCVKLLNVSRWMRLVGG